ncbi:hypothetical protein [Olivibacter oleidegradans]|uniref:Uncharacterized protein n=1 Tax=Olivibacter oleidegradans TaxID=760123 RepID=A0ABV6HDG0_9SPHI
MRWSFNFVYFLSPRKKDSKESSGWLTPLQFVAACPFAKGDTPDNGYPFVRLLL